MTAATRLSAARSSSGETCEYTSNVIPTLAWPRRSWMTFGCSPALSARSLPLYEVNRTVAQSYLGLQRPGPGELQWPRTRSRRCRPPRSHRRRHLRSTLDPRRPQVAGRGRSMAGTAELVDGEPTAVGGGEAMDQETGEGEHRDRAQELRAALKVLSGYLFELENSVFDGPPERPAGIQPSDASTADEAELEACVEAMYEHIEGLEEEVYEDGPFTITGERDEMVQARNALRPLGEDPEPTQTEDAELFREELADLARELSWTWDEAKGAWLFTKDDRACWIQVEGPSDDYPMRDPFFVISGGDFTAGGEQVDDLGEAERLIALLDDGNAKASDVRVSRLLLRSAL